MKLSLTPYEDAAREAAADVPELSDPLKDAIRRVVSNAVIESCRLRDQGLDNDDVVNFVASVCISVVASTTQNIASAFDEAEAPYRAAALNGAIIAMILKGLNDNRPFWTSRAEISEPHGTGRA